MYGSCIHLNIRNQTDGILRSPEKIIFTKFIFFSPGEIILEKIFGLLILFVFRVWSSSALSLRLSRAGPRMNLPFFLWGKMEPIFRGKLKCVE